MNLHHATTSHWATVAFIHTPSKYQIVMSHRHGDLWPCVCPCNPVLVYHCCSVKGKVEENSWCHKGKCSEVWEEQEMSINSTLSWISGQSDCWQDSTGLSRKDWSVCEVRSEYTKCSHWTDLSKPLLCLKKKKKPRIGPLEYIWITPLMWNQTG